MGMRIYAVFLTIVGLMWLHIVRRLLLPAQLPMPYAGLAYAAVAALVGYQILCMVPAFNVRKRPWALTCNYLATGYLMYLWLALLVRELVVCIAWLAGFAWAPPELAVVSAITWGVGSLATLVGIATAWLGPKVKRVEVQLPHWPASQDGFKILQISDLHVGPLIRERYVERVVRKVLRTAPDIVAVTGDLGDGDPAMLTNSLASLRKLQATHGVYYVTGNHEYYWGARGWIQAVEERGMIALLNKGCEIVLSAGQSLWLGGLPDFTAAHFIPAHKADLAAASPPPGRAFAARVLLAHQPKSFEGVAEAGFDLMLCGHTHNGQSFPFNFFVGRFNPFSRGLNRVQQLLIYVNAGTGYWGPPLRLGVRSEITCLVLRRQQIG